MKSRSEAGGNAVNAGPLEVDYLIVGGGAGGLAFADTLLSESDVTMAVVDERHSPGGHWNDVYRFVRLHQPSSFYGVNSTPLGDDAIESSGSNEGLSETATGAEVCAYFEHVMERVLLPSRRVHYFPKHRFLSDGRVVSLMDGVERTIRVRKKAVDTTYTAGTIPARHEPNYSIDPGMCHVPVGELAAIETPPEGYVVIGAGKTGMDACLWLLERGVDPDAIRWIVSQDAWLVDRAKVQPMDRFFESAVGALAVQMEAAARAASIADLFEKLEAGGILLRLDPTVTPTAYRCATVTQGELHQLRRLKNVVRLGRVKAIESTRIMLELGELPTNARVAHIDCSAKGVAPRPVRPIFAGDRITVQMVRACQPTFSAALIAYVEAHHENEALKNTLCGVIQGPDRDIDWPRMRLADTMNAFQWSQDAGLTDWLSRCRLNVGRALLGPSDALSPEQAAVRQRLRDAVPAAVENLQRLLSPELGKNA